MNGLHIIAEFHDCACPPALLREVSALRALCLSACGAPGLTVVAEAFHGFGSVEAWFGWQGKDGLAVTLAGHNLGNSVQRNAVSLNKDEVLMPGRDVRLAVHVTESLRQMGDRRDDRPQERGLEAEKKREG